MRKTQIVVIVNLLNDNMNLHKSVLLKIRTATLVIF